MESTTSLALHTNSDTRQLVLMNVLCRQCFSIIVYPFTSPLLYILNHDIIHDYILQVMFLEQQKLQIRTKKTYASPTDPKWKSQWSLVSWSTINIITLTMSCTMHVYTHIVKVLGLLDKAIDKWMLGDPKYFRAKLVTIHTISIRGCCLE